MYEPSASAKPRIILLVTGVEQRLGFAAAPVSNPGVYPYVLDADNLRTAAVLANRLDEDANGNTPLPLLRIRAGHRHGYGRPSDVIEFPRVPRLLAGLIADAVRAGVAAGAVVSVAEGAHSRRQHREEIAKQLELAGFDVTGEVPGWVAEETCLSLSL